MGKGAYDFIKGGKTASAATSTAANVASKSGGGLLKSGLKSAGKLARFIPGVGWALSAGMSVLDGWNAATDDEAIMAQTGKKEVGTYDRIKHGLGGVASGLTFGLVDSSTVVNAGESFFNFLSGKGWNTNKELNEDPSKEGGFLSKAASWLNPVGWGSKIVDFFSGDDKKEENKDKGFLSKLNPLNWFSDDEKEKVEEIKKEIPKKLDKPIASGIGTKTSSENFSKLDMSNLIKGEPEKLDELNELVSSESVSLETEDGWRKATNKEAADFYGNEANFYFAAWQEAKKRGDHL